MRAAFGSIKLFSCCFFFWMVLGVPGFCPLRGAAGVEGTWRGCALQVTVASPQSRRGCEGHLSRSPLWDVRRGACRGMVVVAPSELALGQGRVAPSLVLFCCCSPCDLGKSSAGSEPQSLHPSSQDPSGWTLLSPPSDGPRPASVQPHQP